MHLSTRGNSKTGYSTSFSRYPLPMSSKKVSRNTCAPSTNKTSETESPTTLRSCSKTAALQRASPLYLYLLGWATHTLRNVSRSHVGTKTRVSSALFPNSTLKWRHIFTQLKTRESNCGNIPCSKIKWEQKSVKKTWNKNMFLRNPHVF